MCVNTLNTPSSSSHSDKFSMASIEPVLRHADMCWKCPEWYIWTCLSPQPQTLGRFPLWQKYVWAERYVSIRIIIWVGDPDISGAHISHTLNTSALMMHLTEASKEPPHTHLALLFYTHNMHTPFIIYEKCRHEEFATRGSFKKNANLVVNHIPLYVLHSLKYERTSPELFYACLCEKHISEYEKFGIFLL